MSGLSEDQPQERDGLLFERNLIPYRRKTD